MTIDEEYRLIRLAKENDQDAQEALLNQFDDLLCGVAYRYRARIGFPEMYQVAALKFLECVRYFDTERDPPLRLMTYVHTPVYRKCHDESRRGNRVVTVPHYTAQNLENEVQRALSTSSFDQGTTVRPEGSADEIAYRDEISVPEFVSKKLEVEELTKKLANLRERYRYVIERRMSGDEFPEIGACLGVTKQRAEQIAKAATKKLREMYRQEKQEIAIA